MSNCRLAELTSRTGERIRNSRRAGAKASRILDRQVSRFRSFGPARPCSNRALGQRRSDRQPANAQAPKTPPPAGHTGSVPPPTASRTSGVGPTRSASAENGVAGIDSPGPALHSMKLHRPVDPLPKIPILDRHPVDHRVPSANGYFAIRPGQTESRDSRDDWRHAASHATADRVPRVRGRRPAAPVARRDIPGSSSAASTIVSP